MLYHPAVKWIPITALVVGEGCRLGGAASHDRGCLETIEGAGKKNGGRPTAGDDFGDNLAEAC